MSVAVQDVVKVLIKTGATGAAKQKMPKPEDVVQGYILARLIGHRTMGAFLSVFLYSKGLNQGEGALLAAQYRKTSIPRLYVALTVALGRQPGDNTIDGFVVITKNTETYSYGHKITTTSGYVVYLNDIKTYFVYKNPLVHSSLNQTLIQDITSYVKLKTAAQEIAKQLAAAKKTSPG
jgi:hypothetical protein